jgi:hypothetical protein
MWTFTAGVNDPHGIVIIMRLLVLFAAIAECVALCVAAHAKMVNARLEFPVMVGLQRM